jgi:endonuclease YncB( thermonuclease family)
MYTYKISNVDRIVDGDTIDVTIDLGFKILTKQRIRMYGINTPETRTRDKQEKQRGLAAKARLVELLQTENDIILKSHGVGKFGRGLGELFINDTNVNETLVNEGHAVKYFGGSR